MIMRALDVNGDWKFGRGKNDFKRGIDALVLSINTRLSSFKYDCFFANKDGVDWFGFLGGKNLTQMRLAISAIILQTPNVTAINEVNFYVDTNRRVTISWSATTAFSTISNVQSVNSTVTVAVNGQTF